MGQLFANCQVCNLGKLNDDDEDDEDDEDDDKELVKFATWETSISAGIFTITVIMCLMLMTKIIGVNNDQQTCK